VRSHSAKNDGGRPPGLMRGVRQQTLNEPPVRSLDDLLGSEELHASFHDALLLQVRIDYSARTVHALFDLAVGDPDAPDQTERHRRRKGRLTLEGLIFWVHEPPERATPPATTGVPGLRAMGLYASRELKPLAF
jgi:hypothetical protein